jgi:hypothetical protein
LPPYQRSLSDIKARLGAGDWHLQLALLTLAAGEGAYYTAFAIACRSIAPNATTLLLPRSAR